MRSEMDGFRLQTTLSDATVNPMRILQKEMNKTIIWALVLGSRGFFSVCFLVPVDITDSVRFNAAPIDSQLFILLIAYCIL